MMKFLKTLLIGSALFALGLSNTSLSFAKLVKKQQKNSSVLRKRPVKKSPCRKNKALVPLAESNLGGIYLFDPATKLVDVYGSPEQIEAAQSEQEKETEGAGTQSQPGTPAPPKAPEELTPEEKEKEVLYTRWVYKKNSSQYSFILDKQGRVVQIEALGLSDPKAHTRKGVHLGSWMADVVQKYGAPEGYQIAENYVLAQYYQKYQLAFRLSKLEADQPYKVVGILISAGKI